MRYISLLLILVSLTSKAQIKGNGIIETRSYTVGNLQTIKINLYADISIDTSIKEEIIITTDTNIFDLVDKEVVDGVLKLEQIEWIQPSKRPKIIIGAPNLTMVEQGTNNTVKVVNIDNEKLQLTALIGKIIAEGKVKTLNVNAETGTVDASKLESLNANVNIWNRGKAILNVKNELDSKLDTNAKIRVVNTPKILKGDSKKSLAQSKTLSNQDSVRYIKFKIKNNSLSRNQFFVVGPKPDGSSFGYGFPMMPQSTRKETWTTGTKVYKVNALGFRKLLITITPENENQTVKLF